MSKASTPRLKAHPYADLFPMMAADELEALAADIAAVGLRQPIVRYQGAILDGRNRLAACEKAGVEPRFVEHESDEASALALVISLNVQRRDLTAGQRALVAAKVLEQFPERRGRPKKGASSIQNNSRQEVAREFKVGEQAVQQAKALLNEATDLTTQVESCTTPLWLPPTNSSRNAAESPPRKSATANGLPLTKRQSAAEK